MAVGPSDGRSKRIAAQSASERNVNSPFIIRIKVEAMKDGRGLKN
jgi:hypothetical protein